IDRVAVTAKAVAGEAKKQTMGTGGVSAHLMGAHSLSPAPMHVMSNPSPLLTSTVDDVMDFGEWGVRLNDVALDKAERRHVKVETVEFDWQLSWVNNQLEIRLFGNPASRPFQCYVVVEEIVYSGETAPQNLGDVLGDLQLIERIHTPFVGEMVNQVVFV